MSYLPENSNERNTCEEGNLTSKLAKKKNLTVAIVVVLVCACAIAIPILASIRYTSSNTENAPSNQERSILDKIRPPFNNHHFLNNPNSTNFPKPRNTSLFISLASAMIASTNAASNVEYPWVNNNFSWLQSTNWEYSDGSDVIDSVFSAASGKITVGHDSNQPLTTFPLRTKQAWPGEKVVLVKWTANSNSDTNIWMLSENINPQFGENNGWPFYGELDIFEMLRNEPSTIFTRSGHFNGPEDYGQFTLHFGGDAMSKACFCDAAPDLNSWYLGMPPLVSGCAAQFKNTPNVENSIATIFDKDEKGFFLQLIQHPVVKTDLQGNVNIEGGENSVVTPKIYTTSEKFFGANTNCGIGNNGFNPDTGFPFFTSAFRLILQEQSYQTGIKNGQFVIDDIQIYLKRK